MLSLQTSLRPGAAGRETAQAEETSGRRAGDRVHGFGRFIAFHRVACADFLPPSAHRCSPTRTSRRRPGCGARRWHGRLQHPDAGPPPAPSRQSGETVTAPTQMQEACLAWLASDGAKPSLRVLFAMLAGGGPFQPRRPHAGASTSDRPGSEHVLRVSTHGRRAIELRIQTFGVDSSPAGRHRSSIRARHWMPSAVSAML